MDHIIKWRGEPQPGSNLTEGFCDARHPVMDGMISHMLSLLQLQPVILIYNI